MKCDFESGVEIKISHYEKWGKKKSCPTLKYINCAFYCGLKFWVRRIREMHGN